MYAVAVATVAPTPSPVRMRATSNPASDCQLMKTSAAAIARVSAGSRTALRPYQSDTWPTSRRLIVTPSLLHTRNGYSRSAI